MSLNDQIGVARGRLLAAAGRTAGEPGTTTRDHHDSHQGRVHFLLPLFVHLTAPYHRATRTETKCRKADMALNETVT
jgi:hypothetical protein